MTDRQEDRNGTGRTEPTDYQRAADGARRIAETFYPATGEAGTLAESFRSCRAAVAEVAAALARERSRVAEEAVSRLGYGVSALSGGRASLDRVEGRRYEWLMAFSAWHRDHRLMAEFEVPGLRPSDVDDAIAQVLATLRVSPPREPGPAPTYGCHFVGYRAWRLADGELRPLNDWVDREAAATSAPADALWRGSRWVHARCLRRPHDAPAPNCHCGVNAWSDLRHMRQARPPRVIGAVQATGAIEVHDWMPRGFRAERARPVAVLCPNGTAEAEQLGPLGIARVETLEELREFAQEFGEPAPHEGVSTPLRLLRLQRGSDDMIRWSPSAHAHF